MDRELTLSDVDILHAFLHGEPSLVVREIPDVGKLFEVSFTACCRPLSVSFWFNSTSRGVFIRVEVPATGTPPDRNELLAELNRINLALPVGAFAADLESGDVRYKNAVFVGELPLHVEILGNLVASSFEMVRTNYADVVRAMTGRPHAH